MVRTITLRTPYITLGQLLKLLRMIEAGGRAAEYLAAHQVSVNGERETRRGRKLYGGDRVAIGSEVCLLAAQADASGTN